jgi:hypothetical protein
MLSLPNVTGVPWLYQSIKSGGSGCRRVVAMSRVRCCGQDEERTEHCCDQQPQGRSYKRIGHQCIPCAGLVDTRPKWFLRERVRE